MKGPTRFCGCHSWIAQVFPESASLSIHENQFGGCWAEKAAGHYISLHRATPRMSINVRILPRDRPKPAG